MGAETHGGSGMQELMPERGRDVQQGTVPAQPSLQFELMGYFCGCSVARATDGGQGQGLFLAGTCHGRCSSGHPVATVTMPQVMSGDVTRQSAQC